MASRIKLKMTSLLVLWMAFSSIGHAAFLMQSLDGERVDFHDYIGDGHR